MINRRELFEYGFDVSGRTLRDDHRDLDEVVMTENTSVLMYTVDSRGTSWSSISMIYVLSPQCQAAPSVYLKYE